ncbi:MAG: LysM peptidoglycan-binding domain-containing protein [Anaerolineae bacterium]|nr:LysM peptidoglycan-binding domain-containing protein [Anaerolineae bacterium]MCO5198485.1 LysM peptidoglycan-binding domain-containing protein [Anaerolineae bacterium]
MRKIVSMGLLLLLLFLLPAVVLAQEPTAQPTEQSTGQPESAETEPIIHVVVEGDTLFGIAQQYNTTVAALLFLNNLTETSVLTLGQQLIVSGDVPEVTPVPDSAETDPTIPKVHIVIAGDTLFSIAEQYNIELDDLLQVNRIAPDAVLTVGQELLIPGVPGTTTLVVYTVQYGDTLDDLALRFNTDAAGIVTANKLLNPDYLVAGQQLTINSRTGSAKPYELTGGTHFAAPGDTELLVAAEYGMSPVTLARLNEPRDMRFLPPGERLHVVGTEPFRRLPGRWMTLGTNVAPQQGYTFAVWAQTANDSEIIGRISHANGYSQTIPFMPYEDAQVAIMGLDSFAEPGIYTLALSAADATFEQDVFVAGNDFGAQAIVLSEELSELLDYELRAAEDRYLGQFYSQFTPQKQWDGLFEPPVVQSTVSADYGDARSYNGGPYLTFHAGTDYALPQGTPVVAAAPGVVVFNDLTAIHGQIVIVDHGMGVMTSYSHLSQTAVTVGEQVDVGQLIGAIGTTGSSTGFHLHWEVRVHDIAVNPVQWLDVAFP